MKDPIPTLVVHCDWSVSAKKRVLAQASWSIESCAYQAFSPEPVGLSGDLLNSLLSKKPEGGPLLVGFDFPIGLPGSFAELANVSRFLDLLPRLGNAEWSEFYHPAAAPGQIHLHRPFYPLRPGSARIEHLLAGLGFESVGKLRRRCEQPHPKRRAAAPLFWTMGAQQVGKAAIHGWEHVLEPALRRFGGELGIWPFSGSFFQLLKDKTIVIAETYPAEYYDRLGVRWQTGRSSPSSGWKRSAQARAAQAKALLSWAERSGVRLDEELQSQITSGFEQGEDAFDAVIGLFGMLEVVLGRRTPGDPDVRDTSIREIEGWILGLFRNTCSL